MTLKNYLTLSFRQSANSTNSKRHHSRMSLSGALVMIITLTLSIAGQTNTTNSDIRTPSGMAPGAPAGTYPLSGFENINLYNGNLSFNLPLMTVGGRGSVSSLITIAMNTKSWRVNHFHRVMPDESEIDWFSPTTQNCSGGGTGYSPGSVRGRRTGVFTSSSFSCGTRFSKTLSRLTFVLPDGTEYELRDQLTGGEPKSVAGFACNSGFSRGTVFVTADGSAATFISDTPIVDNGTLFQGCGGFSVSGFMLLRDGTRYRIDGGLVTWIRDRNGNKISYTYDATGRLITITDPLNRQITINYDVSEPAPYGVSDQIIFKGAGGAQRIIRISKTTLANALRANSGFSIQTHQQLFPELNHSSTTTTHNPTVISKVWLPNSDGSGQHHQFYQFFYNSYGELSRIELPTGGAFEYDMTPGSGVVLGCQFCDEPQINRRVRERRVYANGSSGSTFESKTTYEVTSDATPFDPFPWSSTVTTETTNQSGGVVARSRHFFEGSALVSLFKSYGADIYSVWNEGREKKTESLNTSGPLASATVLRRTETTLQQRTSIPWWNSWCSTMGVNCAAEPPSDTRVTETKTTIEPSGANLVTKEVFGYDDSVPFNNQNNVKEYAFGSGVPGALLRETRTTFLTASNYTGTNVHLRSLTTQVSVFEGATERSRSTIAYDNYTAGGNFAALTDRPNISGFDSAFGTQYTTRGNATSSTRYFLVNGLETGSVSTFTQYDIAGNPVKSIDARGFATTSDFTDRFGGPDADARVNSGSTELNVAGKFSYAYPTLVTNALGHTTYTQFDYYIGKGVDTEDVNGVVSSVFYNDPLDRSTQIVQGSNLSGTPKTQMTFNYDDANRIVTATSDQNTFNDPNPLKTQTVSDQMGRTIETRQYESVSDFITTKTEYDAMGRAYRVSNPYRFGENVLWTTTVFDALGRVTSVTTPDSAVFSTSYSGNTITTTDPTGKQRKSVSDALGRLTSMYEAPNDPSYNYLTTYGYDVLDNLRTVTQGVQTRTFDYDSLKRLKSSTNPESGTTNYQYDNNGNLTQKIDARGVVSTYAYDAVDRNISITYSNDPAGTPNVSRYYDGFRDGVDNNIPYSKGKLWQTETTGTKGSRNTVNSFDALGRPRILSHQFYNGGWGTPYTVTRVYNLAGRVTSQSYPSGREVSYSYDTAGRLSSFSGNLGGTSRTYSTGITYSALGGIIQEQFGTDTALYNKSFFNSRGQRSEIRVGTFHATDNSWWNRGAIINHFSQNCWGACGGSNSSTPMPDNNGSLKKQDVYIPGNDQISSYTQWWQGYDYDPINRLQRVHEYASSGDSQQDYVYDQYGNRRIHQTNTFGAGINKKDFTVNPNNNRLGVPSGQSGTMTYDNAGNLYVDTYSGFAVNRIYDAENRMTSETQSGGVVGSYTYSGGGQRMRRTVAGVETWQVYGIDSELLAEYAANGPLSSPLKEYGYRNGELLISAESSVSAGPPTSGLVAYWKLDENSGTIAADSSGNGHTGTLTNGPTWTTGQAGAALTFDGANDMVSNNGISNVTNNFTVSFWALPTTAHEIDGESTSGIGGVSGQRYALWPWWYDSGHAGAGVSVGTNGVSVYEHAAGYMPAPLVYSGTLSGWTHVTVVYENNQPKLYINGTLVRTGLTSPMSFVHINPAYFGGQSYGYFAGQLDELRVYNRALSAGEVATLTSNAETYTASTDFSSTQGFRNWYYLDSNGSQLPYVPANNWWQQDAILWSSGGHPGVSTDAVRQWRASQSGTIRITGSAADADPGGGDGVTVSIKKGTQILWSQTIANGNLTGFTYDVTTSVQSGDQINFVINRNADTMWDSTNFNPTITYTTGTTAQLYWLVNDQVGTPRMIIDKTGSLGGVKRHDYLPFGEEQLSNQGLRSPALGYGGSDGLRQQFTSKERDIETGLDYFGARYYSSVQGRFTSADYFWKDSQIGDPQSWNKYAYVRNNPLTYIDPTGEMVTVKIETNEKEKKGTITITASIAIYSQGNSNFTQEQLNQARAAIESSIEGSWSGTFEADGITYTVTTDVNVTVHNSESEAKDSGAQNVIGISRGDSKPGKAVSHVNDRPLWGSNGQDTGVWKFSRVVENGQAAHEFTHLLGAPNSDKSSKDISFNSPWVDPPSMYGKATGNDFRHTLGTAINDHREGSRKAISPPCCPFPGARLPAVLGERQSRTSTTTLRAPYRF